ncbi:MAG: MMPL family transporter [Deltaproteobacteria bacterium]|nr:MMPL family transporter [Deltaproteobacteria bacterium]
MARTLLSHPRLFIAAVVLLTFAAAVCSTGVRFDFNMEDMLPDRHPARAVYNSFIEQYGEDDAYYIVALSETDVFNAQTLRDIQDLTKRIETFNIVEEVTSLTNVMFPRVTGDGIEVRPFVEDVPTSQDALEKLRAEAFDNPVLPENFVSLDSTCASIFVKLRAEYNEHEFRADFEPKLRAVLAEYARDGRRFVVGGTPVLRSSYIHYAMLNLMIFIPLSIAMLILILVYLFRRPAGVLLPLATVVSAVILTVALMRLTNVPFNLLTNVLPTVILVVGISDSIHLIIKYREEFLLSGDKTVAIRETIKKIAVACLFTSLTTAVGFGSLATSTNLTVRQFGMVATAGVMIAYLITILLIPSVLALLGPPRMTHARDLETDRLARLLRRTTELAIRRPRAVAIVCAVLSVAAVFGMTRIQRQYYFMQDLDDSTDVYQAYHFLDRTLGSAVPLEIDIQSRSGRTITDPAYLRDVNRFAEKLRTYPEVGKVLSPADFLMEMNRLLEGGGKDQFRLPDSAAANAQYLLLYSLGDPDPTADYISFDQTRVRVSSRTADMGQADFQRIIGELEEFTARELDPDLDVRITGAGPMIVVLVDRLTVDMITSLSLAFAIVFGLVLIEFGSLKLALISMVPNLLPLLAIAGFMGVTGISLNPSTAVTFAVAFGIAVDDTIHFLVRYRRELPVDHNHAGGDPPDDARHGPRDRDDVGGSDHGILRFDDVELYGQSPLRHPRLAPHDGRPPCRSHRPSLDSHAHSAAAARSKRGLRRGTCGVAETAVWEEHGA